MSPAPAEHSVLAFRSKNFSVLIGTVAVLMLSALHWSKLSLKYQCVQAKVNVNGKLSFPLLAKSSKAEMGLC